MPKDVVAFDVSQSENGIHVPKGFEVSKEDGGFFRVRGKYVERVVSMMNSSLPEAIERFQRTAKKIGLDKALRRAGISQGDMVRIGTVELEWDPET